MGHTSCMGSPFPAIRARTSPVFRAELAIMAGSIAVDRPIRSITKIVIIVSYFYSINVLLNLTKCYVIIVSHIRNLLCAYL